MTSKAERLRAARTAAGYKSTQAAAERLAVSASTYRAHENGQNDFSDEQAAHYAKAFGIDPAELIFGRKRPPLVATFDPDAPEAQSDDGAMTVGEHTGTRGIPEGSTPQLDVTAGMGAGGFILTSDGVPGKFGMTFAADHISGYWQLPDQVLTGARHTVVIPVQGNSMAPTLIEGDHVFVDTRHRWPSPDGVYALADDFGGIVVKTLRLSEHRGDEGPYIDVVSDNPDRERYPVKTRPADELRIIGRVVRRFSAVF